MIILNIINILLIIFISISTTFISLLLLLYSQKNYRIFNRKPIHFLFITININILFISYFLENIFNNKIHHLIYFNLRSIPLLFTISLYIDRAIIFYSDYIHIQKLIESYNNKNRKIFTINKIKLIRYSILTYNLIYIIFIVYVNISYYDKIFYMDNWQYIPNITMQGIFVLLIHPLIIFILNKIKNYEDNIKLDYILSMILLVSGLIVELFVDFKYKEKQYLKFYMLISTTYLSWLFCILPILLNLNLKNNNNNNIISDNNFKLYNECLKLDKDYLEFINFFNEIDEKKKINDIEYIHNIYPIYIKHINILKDKNHNMNRIINKYGNPIENNVLNLKLLNEINNYILSDIYKQFII